MLKTTRDPRKGTFVNSRVNVLVHGKERTQYGSHARPKHLTSSRGTGDVSQMPSMVRRLAFLAKKDHTRVAPARRRSLLRVGTLTKEKELLSSTRKKLVNLILDPIGTSRRPRGLFLEDFCEARIARKSVAKSELGGRRARQTRRGRKGGLTRVVGVSATEMLLSSVLTNGVGGRNRFKEMFGEFLSLLSLR